VPSYRGFVRVLKLNEPKHRISCHCTYTHTETVTEPITELRAATRRKKKCGPYHQPDPPPDSPSAAVVHGTNRRLCCCAIWTSDGTIDCCTARRPPRLLCKHTACKLWLLLAETASVCNTEHQKHVEFNVITVAVMDVAIFWDMAPSSPYANRRFGGTYHRHLQSRNSAEQEILDPENWGDMFLRNVGSQTDYTALYLGRWPQSSRTLTINTWQNVKQSGMKGSRNVQRNTSAFAQRDWRIHRKLWSQDSQCPSRD
jgi:hypothetical protein